jgi:hypothetical protein
MATDKPLPKLSNVHCMTITIVGVLPPITKANEDAENEAQRQFIAAIQRALYEAWPTFQPGHPPMSITIVTLPELRTPDA